MNGRTIELTLSAPGERLDKALTDALPELSRTRIQQLVKEQQILVNGRAAKSSQKLEGGEQVLVNLPDPVDTELVPWEYPLDIRYEDDDLLVINKPAGMVVHPSAGHEQDTLVNAVLAHCPVLPVIGSEKRPGIVHRLDKDTSGLIIVAKNERALRMMQAQFKKRTISKMYLALVDGQVQPPAALIDAPLGRDPSSRKKMGVIPPGSSASRQSRPAQTHYQTVIGYDDYTLLECQPKTGRTHQIRVHLAYIGFPIAGDTIYGRRKRKLGLKRHFLHAAKLTFQRPSDMAEITVSAELPPDLQAALDLLNKP
ncbi:MAG: RluA family pseudouridine synthase [Ardenticatenaceae bacterium]|nr:RluA family pseudouridine synthase [Ardenticatenaceae bacterium]